MQFLQNVKKTDNKPGGSAAVREEIIAISRQFTNSRLALSLQTLEETASTPQNQNRSQP
jgi:hypothetical protein